MSREARTTLQELQETAILHQLSNDVYWFILRAYSIQLDQLAMSQFLHYLSLSQEVFWVHST